MMKISKNMIAIPLSEVVLTAHGSRANLKMERR